MDHSLVTVIDSLLAFASKHAGGLLDLSSLLTEDQIDELTTLDAEFYAQCQISGLSLPVFHDPNGFSRFGNSSLPYSSGTIHQPIKDEAGKVTGEMVGSGMIVVPTPEWKHALKSLRATAQAIKVTAEEKTDPSTRKREKPRRGRPAGSKTKMSDRQLYLNWKAANRETGITKKEFLHAKGLPESGLHAMERGRKQREEKETGWKE